MAGLLCDREAQWSRDSRSTNVMVGRLRLGSLKGVRKMHTGSHAQSLLGGGEPITVPDGWACYGTW